MFQHHQYIDEDERNIEYVVGARNECSISTALPYNNASLMVCICAELAKIIKTSEISQHHLGESTRGVWRWKAAIRNSALSAIPIIHLRGEQWVRKKNTANMDEGPKNNMYTLSPPH